MEELNLVFPKPGKLLSYSAYTPAEDYSPLVDPAKTHIVLKTDDLGRAQAYSQYAPYIKALYEDKTSLFRDIDAAELEVGVISGRFYPVAVGTLSNESVPMIFTTFE